jgi:CxxC-x17-CxxC domain-containing protein
MPYAERTLTCRDCGRSFPFTVEEQEFFAQKGFTNDPVRCPECRAARRAERNADGRGGYSSGGGYGREPRQMYPAVCARCGKDTEVPFQPRGDKPVYCSDCYRQESGSDYRRSR